MTGLLGGLILSTIVPWRRAFRAVRETSLSHALSWFLLAWACWAWLVLDDNETLRYLALCMTGCAGVAVLGARRPYVGAWNFVVLGLLAVMMLPVVEALILRTSTGG